jgi:hypothetical protein
LRDPYVQRTGHSGSTLAPKHKDIEGPGKICIFVKNTVMSAIVIKADNQNTRILRELAKKLGADVLNINEDQFEDLALGIIMDKVKTGETVSRESIMNKLEKK